MKVTKHIHALHIPFRIPISHDKVMERHVYSYIVFGEDITLIDSGVNGSETQIFDYIKMNGISPEEITMVVLTHSHPDHIGSVKTIKEATKCKIVAHSGEKNWIEDTEKQFKERPVPGFHALVGGPVAIDWLIADGDLVDLGNEIKCKVLHTPGHSRGSITLIFEKENAIITGDSLILPNEMPIYDDIVASVNSIKLIRNVNGIETLLSSWEGPIHGHGNIVKRIDDSLSYLRLIHETVLNAKSQGKEDMMDLCRYVVHEIGLPPFAANPLVARAFASNMSASRTMKVFE